MLLKISILALVIFLYGTILIVPAAEEVKYKCLDCDSEKDALCNQKEGEKCALKAKTCETEGVDGCFIYHENDKVVRGCKENPLYDKALKKCTGKLDDGGCNSDCIEPAKCVVCDSSTDDKCVQGDSKEEPCQNNEISCHQCYDKEKLTMVRGCGKGTGKGVCFQCTGSNSAACNKNFMCYQCDQSMKNCASDGYEAKVCGDKENKCYVEVDTSSKGTNRGCCKDDKKCDKETCTMCNDPICNNIPYPDGRLTCYQCSGNSKCNAAQINSDDTKAKPCPLYEKEDKCVMYEGDDGNIVRGCLSTEGTTCTKKPDKCKICPKHACNSAANVFSSTLKCIQCKAGEECAYGYEKSKAEECKTEVKYYEEEFCYAKQLDINKVERGCGLRNVDCSDNKCNRCNWDGCNNENYANRTCAVCRSDMDGEDCAKDGKNFTGKFCEEPGRITYETRGCFIERDSKDVIYRGCIADLETFRLHNCLHNDEYKLCKTCNELDCNVGPPPSGSAVVIRAFPLAILLGIIMILHYQ